MTPPVLPSDFDLSSHHMPAEWEPHRGTWLSWPKKLDTWPGKFGPIPAVWAAMTRALSESEEVHLLVDSPAMEQSVHALLLEYKADLSNIHFHQVPSNDVWIRDYGPIFLKSDTETPNIIALDWIFNSWGGKYPPFDLDDVAPTPICREQNIPLLQKDFVLEGGSIDVNGQGLLLTTEQCLLNKNRNPHLSREQIEEILKSNLGVKKILWLGDGIEGDDTDGHVDDLTRFVGPNTLVTALETNKKDANYKPLRENLERLQGLTNLEGGSLEVIELPMPPAVYHEDHRLPASYANFYIGNKVVLMPTYHDTKKNDQAMGILQDCFPGRKVVGIHAVDLVWGLGACHCVTQQQPL
jgi:agmatine deiminase